MTCTPIDQYRTTRAEAQRRLDELAGPPVRRFFSGFADVGELLVLSDLRFQEAERCRALEVQPGRAKDAFSAGKRYNDMVRRELAERAPILIRDLREHLAEMGDVDATAILKQGEETVRDTLADLPLKGHQAREADRVLRQGFEAAREGGKALCDFMQEHVDELSHRRAEREKHNEPVSLIIGVVAIVAAAAVMIGCASSGTCGQVGVTVLVIFLSLFGGSLVREGVEPLSPLPEDDNFEEDG
jgi:hypothetical protein